MQWVHSMQWVHITQWVCSTQVLVQKVNSHSGLSKYWWWGPLPLVQKGHCTPHTVDAVGAQYAVGVSAKR